MSIKENIDQHLRRKHNELDNIFQVIGWMDGLAKVNLDKNKALDIVKFALSLGDPSRPHSCPSWMKNLLQGKPPTFKNKLGALNTPGVTKKFLDDNHVKIEHPEMNSYQRVVQRVRAINGFGEWNLLHKLVAEELGRRGFANKTFPLSQNLLMDPHILTSKAFTLKTDKDAVPLWRDGASGERLQKAMCEVAAARLFEWGGLNSNKTIFSSGAHWAAFARFCGGPDHFLDSALERTFGSKSSWSGSLKTLHKDIWSGEYDAEIAKMCAVFPATLDSQPIMFERRLLESFGPLVQALHVRESEAQRLQSAAEKRIETEKAEEQARTERASTNSDDQIPKCETDGDVTDSIFSGQDAATKKKMVARLNKDAETQRDNLLQQKFLEAAAEVLRQRLTVVDSSSSAKCFMESAPVRDGIKARTLLVDITQDSNCQCKSTKWSKMLCATPSQAAQKELAENIKRLPMTPIVGSVILRSGGSSIHHLEELLRPAMPYTSEIFVPIDIPATLEKHIKSGARRALGPIADHMEKSGIQYHVRTIGARGADKLSTAAPVTQENQKEEDDNEEGEDPAGEDDVHEVPGVPVDEGLPLELMSRAQLEKHFGRDALAVVGALFQHQGRIAEQGRFLQAKDAVHTVTSRGVKVPYRRGQVHSSVVYSCVKSVLKHSSVPLQSNDAFVQVCGGTPEGIVAAILLGYQHVIYIAGNTAEMDLMKLPTKRDETTFKLNYLEYASMDSDNPNSGMLAAEAVKMLAPFVRNFVLESQNEVMLPSPIEIILPPLRCYTFVQVTGRVLARTINAPESKESKESKESAKSAKSSESKNEAEPKKKKQRVSGPGSADGKEPPKVKPPTGSVSNDEDDKADDVDSKDDDGSKNDDDDDDDNEEDDELAELEKMQEEATTEKKKKGRGRPKGKATPSKKTKK